MIITGKYPQLRMRRSRKYNWSRRLVRENGLSGNDFILPIFIVDGKFNTRNYKAVDWLCTKIENGQTSLILDIQEFEED